MQFYPNCLKALTVFLGLSCAIIARAESDDPLIIEKDGLYYEILKDENGQITNEVEVVGWNDSITELNIPSDVSLEIPIDEGNQLAKSSQNEKFKVTKKFTVIIWFTHGKRFTSKNAPEPPDVSKILQINTHPTLYISGNFRGFSGLRLVQLPEAKTTEIPDSMFFGCSKLESISFPSYTRSIGDDAFAYCSNLKVINFNSGVDVGNSFNHCDAIESVSIPYGCSLSNSFSYCKNLREVYLESGCSLGNNPFMGCENLVSINVAQVFNPDYFAYQGILYDRNGNLICAYPSTIESVVIPNEVRTISQWAFAECHNLRNIIIPYNVQEIRYEAFFNSGLETIDTGDLEQFSNRYSGRQFVGCNNLKSVNIGKNFKTLSINAFSKCKNLSKFTVDEDNVNFKVINDALCSKDYGNKYCLECVPATFEKYIVPDEISSIGEYAFMGSEKLKEVTIPETVYTLQDNAFNGCSSIDNLIVPNSVTAIYSGTFANCTNLKTLTLGSGVNKLRHYAFRGSDNLTTLIVLNPVPPTAYYSYEEDDIFTPFMLENTLLIVPEESLESYRSSSLWSRFKNIKGQSAGVEDIIHNETGLVDVYNLQGICVLKNASKVDIDNLPAGVYISDGKKFIK